VKGLYEIRIVGIYELGELRAEMFGVFFMTSPLPLSAREANKRLLIDYCLLPIAL